MSINQRIKDICEEWLAWVDDGAPTFGAFSRHEGLCGTVNHAMIRAQASNFVNAREADDTVEAFMNYIQSMIFDPDGEPCSGASPFCEPRTYYHSVQLATCHKNPKRIAFAREVVEGKHNFEAGYGK